MKLLLGTIIALLLAALVMSWNGMRDKVAATPDDEVAKLREQVSALRAEQERQALERQYVRNGSLPVAPPADASADLDAMKKQVEESQARLAAIEAEKAAKEKESKLSDEEQLLLDQRDMEKKNSLMREARLVSQALLVAKITEFVEDAQTGNFATIQILMPEQVQVDTILAIRRKTGILGQLKVTAVEGTEAVASQLPGFGPVQPIAGDELILPPRF
ncbi:MAG: hypothetical protein J0M04_09070 [Verrucomicrobia bacterium]|nr:hypothetical protein [Verrucomicrobiota bacterium]